jgi:hypothetical protein
LNLAVGSAVGLDGPARLVAERLEHLVVVAVLGDVVVPVGPETREDLGGDRAAAALAAPVVLPLPPRRDPGAPEPAAAGPVRHPRPDLADLPRPSPSLGLFIISGEGFGGGEGGGAGLDAAAAAPTAAAYCKAGLALGCGGCCWRGWEVWRVTELTGRGNGDDASLAAGAVFFTGSRTHSFRF